MEHRRRRALELVGTIVRIGGHHCLGTPGLLAGFTALGRCLVLDLSDQLPDPAADLSGRKMTPAATAGRDASVRLWDAVTLEEVLRLRGHEGAARALGWSPGGTALVSASADGPGGSVTRRTACG